MKIRVQNMGEVRDKIPLFRGLSNDQVQAIVDVGNLIELEPGRMLCHEGDASREENLLRNRKRICI